MKKNRSNIFTDGICNTLKNDKNLKMVFFELDFIEEMGIPKSIGYLKLNTEYFKKVIETYEKFELDYFIHRTGNGFHFLSPTLIDKILYKKFMDILKDINVSCPMSTLRVNPNKYENEKDYFYKIIEIKKFIQKKWYDNNIRKHFSNNKKSNCLEMCNFLNETFNTDFEGTHKGKIIKVKYPLPQKPFNDFGYPNYKELRNVW